MRRWRACAAVGAFTSLPLLAPTVRAQRFDVERPATFAVGSPPGHRALLGNAGRTGFSRSRLPVDGLRTVWRASLGLAIEHGPLVDALGETVVVGTRGETVDVGADGAERWRVATNAPNPGPATLLSDGSVVFVSGAGEAIAVHGGAVTWRTRFGRGSTPPAPVALDDGGVVVATSHELAVLDGAGGERFRVVLPEPTSCPLIAAPPQVVVIGASGTVWGWLPGAADVLRLGSFGTAIDGAAALAGPRSIVAVHAGGAGISSFDLDRGVVTARAPIETGRWLGPPALRGAVAYLRLRSTLGDMAVSVDAEGTELGRISLGGRGAPPAPDGGIALLPASSRHTPPIVDAAGTMALATNDGSVGVVVGLGTPMATVELVANACPPSLGGAPTHSEAPVSGLAPLGPEAFVAVCASGTLVAIRGGAAAPTRP